MLTGVLYISRQLSANSCELSAIKRQLVRGSSLGGRHDPPHQPLIADR
jgi:hypothetical protein